MNALQVTDVRFCPSSDVSRWRGLLGHIAITLNGTLLLDSLALRRTSAGVTKLFFPERRDSRGRIHKVAWPLAAADRTSIEQQVLDALAAQGVAL